MITKKSVNIPPAPAIPISISSLSDKNVKKYDANRMDKHVLLRFQPTHLISVNKSEYSREQIDLLIEWWKNLDIDGRDNPFTQDASGNVVIVWTFCGGDDADFDNGVYGDDCE